MTEAILEDIDDLLGDRLHDPKRLAALEASGMLDSHAEEAFDRATRLATRIVGIPVSLLSFVDDKRQFFKSQIGLEGWAADDRETPLSHSFCQHVVISDTPLMVSDARQDPLVRNNKAIDDLHVVAYLGVPVHAANGEVLGSLCAIDDKPHEWTESDLSVLRDLATMVETELGLREVAREREVVLQEMNHRVKNLFSLVGGMVRMESRSHDSVDAFAASFDARLRALCEAHELILPKTDGSQDTGGAGLSALVSKLIAPYRMTAEDRIKFDGPDVRLTAEATVPVTLALHEIVTNSVKYGALSPSGGTLRILWSIEDEAFEIRIEDSGVIRTEGPSERTGFGTRLLKTTIELQLGGTRHVRAEDSSFSQKISLPLSVLEG